MFWCRPIYPKDVLSSVRILTSGCACYQIYFSCSYTSRSKVKVFASWDIYKYVKGGGGQRVFRGRWCSHPGLQEGQNALEAPSSFYCAFTTACKSFYYFFLLIRPFHNVPQDWCSKCASLSLSQLQSGWNWIWLWVEATSLLFYVTQHDRNNEKWSQLAH